jgi:hypothetical protein
MAVAIAVDAKRKVVKTFCFRPLRFDLAILSDAGEISKSNEDPRDALLLHEHTPTICTPVTGHVVATASPWNQPQPRKTRHRRRNHRS